MKLNGRTTIKITRREQGNGRAGEEAFQWARRCGLQCRVATLSAVFDSVVVVWDLPVHGQRQLVVIL